MDRLEFVHLLSSRSNNIEVKDIIINFFDQYMIMYDMLNGVDDIFIANADNFNISFQMIFNDTDDVEELINHLASIPVVKVYESVYSITCNRINEYTVIVSISR